MSAHLHRHVLVMHHKHPGDIGLDPRSLELVLLPLRQQVVDGVLELVMIFVVVAGNHLPWSISYCILVSGSESWTLVMAEHIRSVEDLQDCLILFSSRAWNSLDSELWWSGDVDVVQQIPQSASGDCGFISKGLDLVGVMVRLFLLSIAQRSVVFIIFAFNLIAFFFIILVVVVVVPWQLLTFLHVFSCRYRDHYHEGILLLRNELRRVRLRLRLKWHIPWRELTSGLTSSALASCAVRTNHLKLRNMRE
jgi:hypothetical protein